MPNSRPTANGSPRLPKLPAVTDWAIQKIQREWEARPSNSPRDLRLLGLTWGDDDTIGDSAGEDRLDEYVLVRRFQSHTLLSSRTRPRAKPDS